MSLEILPKIFDNMRKQMGEQLALAKETFEEEVHASMPKADLDKYLKKTRQRGMVLVIWMNKMDATILDGSAKLADQIHAAEKVINDHQLHGPDYTNDATRGSAPPSNKIAISMLIERLAASQDGIRDMEALLSAAISGRRMNRQEFRAKQARISRLEVELKAQKTELTAKNTEFDALKTAYRTEEAETRRLQAIIDTHMHRDEVMKSAIAAKGKETAAFYQSLQEQFDQE